MNPFLGAAMYLILWWLTFFVMLPIGAQSFHEAGEETVPGSDAGAPRVHRLKFKMALASVIAAVLWLAAAWAVTHDLFMVRTR